MKKIIILLLFISLISLIYSCSEKAKSTLGPVGAPVSLQISPDSTTVPTGQTIRFIAYGLDNNNNRIDLNPTWSVQNGIGYMDQYGDFYGTNAATGSISASYQNLTATIPVTVIPGIFWIYSGTHTQNFLYGQADPPTPFGGELGQWGACNIGADDHFDYPAGENKSLVFTYTGAGGIFWIFSNVAITTTTDENMSVYNSGHLNFWIKVTNIGSLIIKVESDPGDVGHSVNVSSYISASSAWQYLHIPFSDFVPGLTLSRTRVPIGVHNGTGTVKMSGVNYSPN